MKTITKPEITATVYSGRFLKEIKAIDKVNDHLFESSVDEVKILIKTHAISDQHSRATGGELYVMFEAMYLNKLENKEQKYPFDVKIEDYKGLDYIVSISLTDKLATFIINEG
jgi:hypothetical protein